MSVGSLLESQGKRPEAEQYFREVLDIQRRVLGEDQVDTLRSLNNLGILLVEQGKLKDAISHYTEAVRIKPDYAKAYYNLGIVLADQGKLEDAISRYTEALRIKP